MNACSLLRSTLLSTCLVASMAASQIQTPQFAILNLPSGTYLQMDVQGLSGTEEPRIDTIQIRLKKETTLSDGGLQQAKASLMVFWSKVPLTVNAPEAITSAQVIKKIELPAVPSCPTCDDTLKALRVDTISFAMYTSSALQRQFDPPHVDDISLTPRDYCVILYGLPACRTEKDGCKAELVQRFVNAWKAKAFAAILEPSATATFVYASPWSRTTGKEEIPGVATSRPGNASNWIDVSRAQFATRSILKPPQTPAPGQELTLLPMWSIPDGAVRYVYNRSASPDEKILEDGDHRVFGSLLKIGSTLDASRQARPRGCLPPIVDTSLGSSSWLVLADSASESALESALLPTDFPFGPDRESAWRISGDTVWLDGATTIRLPDLLAAAHVSSHATAAGAFERCRLVRTPDGIALDLDRASEVRAIAADGRILSAWARHPAGRTALSASRGVAFVQIRAAGLATTIPVLR